MSDKEQYRAFMRKTEGLVRPEDITPISFLGDFNRMLPVKAQNTIMKKGSADIPYMGFIVDPWCFFVTWAIKDVAAASKLLPDAYELAPTTVFANGQKHYSLITGVFSVRTSAFMGMRMEAYLIARRKDDGRMAWIIVDYVTNTNSHDPASGFTGYNGDPVFVALSPYNELLAELAQKGADAPRFAARANLDVAQPARLDQDLWVEGNLCIDYGARLKDADASPFSLIFDPVLMDKALQVPLDALQIEENGFFPDLVDGMSPVSCAVFPCSQHFVIKQDLPPGSLKTAADMDLRRREFLLASRFKTMRGDDLKKPLLRGMIASAIINYTIIGVLLYLLLR